MPELPEVETLKQELEPELKGKTVERIKVWEPKTVLPLRPRQFRDKLKNRSVVELERQAKLLLIKLDQGYLMIHLKMTGQMIFIPGQGEAVIGGHPQPGGTDNLPNRFTRLAIYLTDGSTLYFNDMRKFGWVRFSPDPNQETFITGIGIEPLSKQFTTEVLTEFINKYPKRKIKQLLLDQGLIAGLGNIYVDEALHLSGLRPDRSVTKIKDQEIKLLHQAIQSVLRLSIKKKGTSFRDYKRSNGQPGGFVSYLKVYSRAGQPCLYCGQPIKKIKLAGRGTHYCSECQK